ncbi:hypothetical protein HMPREF9696_02554 [Afipia clevelandensis ATCC 49720]|uniref:Uncharacterized protein n=1 Tax=Afipia clevelandensis ATCC 49720 TaxID=883079 RepID=K8NYA1_9BRAD|nr:hypothetical protein HMPREF9696_02554 [Afipia clevelandensis ATCC 49720]
MMRLVKSSQTNSRGLKANATYHEMCLFYADFKRFRGLQGRYLPPIGNISSSIRANLPSIMRTEAIAVRED